MILLFLNENFGAQRGRKRLITFFGQRCSILKKWYTLVLWSLADFSSATRRVTVHPVSGASHQKSKYVPWCFHRLRYYCYTWKSTWLSKFQISFWKWLVSTRPVALNSKFLSQPYFSSWPSTWLTEPTLLIVLYDVLALRLLSINSY